MINLFNINNHTIDTSDYSNLLHDKIVTEFEKTISDYVGAKYAVSFNSATSAIFLALLNKNITVKVPSIIPPVVINAIQTSGNKYEFVDDIGWVGDSYVLHQFEDYKIVDSAQKLEKDQFKKTCCAGDLMVFSFYPTKPIGSCDGGMIVSNDFDKIQHLKELSLNGMSYSKDNWDRQIKFFGYKMYMNSVQSHIALMNFARYEEKLMSLERLKNIYNRELLLANTSNHLYRICVKNRDRFMKYMDNQGIQTGIHYRAAHLNPVYRNIDTSLPLSEKNEIETVSIPFHENLSDKEINFIVECIRNYE